MTVRTLPRPKNSDHDTVCDPVGSQRQIRAPLTAPLGARVLVGTGGLPIEVTTGP